MLVGVALAEHNIPHSHKIMVRRPSTRMGRRHDSTETVLIPASATQICIVVDIEPDTWLRATMIVLTTACPILGTNTLTTVTVIAPTDRTTTARA